MIRTIKTLVHEGKQLFTYPIRHRRFEEMIDNGLPHQMRKAIEFLLNRKIDRNTKDITCKIEGIRSQIAAQGNKKVPILYSPKPGSSGTDSSLSARPRHGQILEFTMEQVARTGINKYWGTFLYLCAVSFRSEVIVELGSCIGISACYLSSSPFCKCLITVEGSEILAKLAKSNLAQITNKAIVYNMLFDDALDEFLPKLQKGIDFALIDGHHEKTATIHYFERLRSKLNKGAVIIFDDISWSCDMREAWYYLSRIPGFSYVFDLGKVGMCIWCNDKSYQEKHWDLQPIIGHVSIGIPHGWIQK